MWVIPEAGFSLILACCQGGESRLTLQLANGPPVPHSGGHTHTALISSGFLSPEVGGVSCDRKV